MVRYTSALPFKRAGGALDQVKQREYWRMRGLLYSLVLCLGLMPVAEAQQTNPPVQSAPAPNPSAPNPSAPILPAPGSLTTPPAPPVTQPVQPPSAAQDPTPQPPGTAPQTDGVKTPEVGGPTELVLEAKPVILFRGQSTWDDGFDTLMESFQKLANEAKRLKLGTPGRPQAAFTATDDFGFRFEAMLALDSEPATPPAGIGKEFSIGKSPVGKALKFTHAGAYDDIDTTYEAITAYLDEKGLKARNIFVEEYMNDPKTSEDSALEMNIYVLVE
jgi:effector-binding domain-containing protein